MSSRLFSLFPLLSPLSPPLSLLPLPLLLSPSFQKKKTISTETKNRKMEHHEEFDEVVYDPHLKCLVLPSELSSTPPSSLAPLPLSSSPLSSSSLSSSSSTSPSPPPFEISGEQEEKFKIAVKNTTPPISMFSCYGEKLVYKLDCIRGTTEGKNLSQSSSCLPLCLVNLYRHSLFLQRALFFASPLVWLAAVVVSIISGEEGSFPVFFLSLLMFAALLMFESIGLVFIDLELGLAWSFFLVRYVPQFRFSFLINIFFLILFFNS